jgi:4-hydroxybenzoate polyprenyltransferase
MIQFSKYLINSNVFISLCALFHFSYYSLVVRNQIVYHEVIIIFCGTLISYHLVRLIPYFLNKNFHGEIKKFYDTNLKLSTLTIIISTLAILLNIQSLGRFKFLNLLHLLIIVLLYELRLKSYRGLRYIPYVKPVIISYVWSLTCVGMNYNSFSNIDIDLLIGCFIFTLFLSIPYDIKDHIDDKKQRLRTVVHLFKKQTSLTFMLAIFYSIFSIYSYIQQGNLYYLILAPFYIFLLWLLNKNKSTYIFNYGFDGLIILFSLLGIYFR